MTEVFVSTDIDASEALLREQYAAMRIKASGDRHLMRIAQHQLGPVRFDWTRIHMSLEADAEPLGSLVVGRISSGRACYRSDGEHREYRCGDVYVSAMPEAGFHVDVENADVQLAVLDPALLGEIADPGPRPGEEVRLLGHSPVSAEAAALWWRTFSFVLASSKASTVDPSPIFEQEAARLLVAATLAAFPTTAATEPTIEDRHDAHERTLRRASAFIDANAWRDITVKEIAESAGVTVRAVQLSFRRHLDTTPTAYLRGVRLQYVHDELSSTTPDRTTVSEVAGQWGFSNFGRFAAQYRTRFGELPGQTLRR